MKKSKSILAGTMVASAFVMQGTISNAQSGPSGKSLTNESIRPFQVYVPEAQLTDLRHRI